MKYSVFTVSMPEYDVRETVKVLKELGYEGVEWRVAAPAPERKPDNYTYEGRYWSYNLSTLDIKRIEEEAAAAKQICDEAGIAVVSLTSYLGVWNTKEAEKLMMAAKKIGCSNIRINAPQYDEKENYRVLFAKTVEQTKKIEELAGKYNVRANFEIHMGNIIPSASAAYRFASKFDPKFVGIIFDPGNMVYEGFENYRLGIELLGEYLSCIHVKNAAWKLAETNKDGVEKWKAGWAPLKKGYADIQKLLQVLKETGYDGFVSVEDFSNEEETYMKLKNNLELLKKISDGLI